MLSLACVLGQHASAPLLWPPRRFPIGQVEQVKKWPHSVLQEYWSRWYFPANMTLYVVGDLDRCA